VLCCIVLSVMYTVIIYNENGNSDYLQVNMNTIYISVLQLVRMWRESYWIIVDFLFLSLLL
jgi:hypothetical protein